MTDAQPACPIRCGDSVRHEPTGENWLVAYVDGDYLAWCGWPEGEAKLADCTLIKRCADEQHLAMLHQVARSRGKRARMAWSALHAIEPLVAQ